MLAWINFFSAFLFLFHSLLNNDYSWRVGFFAICMTSTVMFLRGSTRKEFVRLTFVVNDRLRGFAKCKRECYRWNTNDWTDEKVIFLTREKEKLVHVGDCLLLMGVLYLRCSACVIKNKIGLTDCCTTDRQQLFFAAYIVGFHMTSLKIKLKNYRSYRDFTFTMH